MIKQRLGRDRKVLDVVFQLVVIALISAVGNIVFKLGSDGFGQLSLGSILSRDFFIQMFTTRFGWMIFGSFAVGLVGRILLIVPINQGSFGLVWALVTPISLAFTLIVGYFIFYDAYTFRELFGIVLVVAGTFFMSS